ncbi:hemerythrin domain-containing protein [Planobispora longispora]|uniref:Hemerythrin-like domain-containing protein n=1 Tax=Planobispora longispora TaxID=28887 RepID=A0A8J3RK28_9ACTN|nr:hemerythrin domain-containing protein [Planobispora longispora]BFE85874.1 hypothetical protein GCM10020093_084750 [Planobispora longispora]GIH76105.1 hypothetical protein Plo01_25340 [Planobispora longispora]
MTPDLLGLTIAHRAMRGDARRMAVLATELAASGRRVGPARATAISEDVAKLCKSIHHHHTTEDQVLWPVIERSAGAEVDLRDLSDDHSALDPLLAEISGHAARFAATRDAADLAAALTRLADLLDEHIAEEERLIFPVITRYVSAADWKTVEDAARRGSDIRFDLPRVERYARPEELARLHKAAGPVLTLLLALVRPGYRRRQRLIFGSAA